MMGGGVSVGCAYRSRRCRSCPTFLRMSIHKCIAKNTLSPSSRPSQPPRCQLHIQPCQQLPETNQETVSLHCWKMKQNLVHLHSLRGQKIILMEGVSRRADERWLLYICGGQPLTGDRCRPRNNGRLLKSAM